MKQTRTRRLGEHIILTQNVRLTRSVRHTSLKVKRNVLMIVELKKKCIVILQRDLTN